MYTLHAVTYTMCTKRSTTFDHIYTSYMLIHPDTAQPPVTHINAHIHKKTDTYMTPSLLTFTTSNRGASSRCHYLTAAHTMPSACNTHETHKFNNIHIPPSAHESNIYIARPQLQ
jgi:hypothetical protein